jgi:nucleotide-binding universal stress UspA family protein
MTPEHDGPVLLCFDGSPAARDAIGGAAPFVARRRALVLTVWSAPVGMAVHGLAAEARAYEAAEAQRAGAQAAEGCEIARGAGFTAEPITACGSSEGTWHAILSAADEHDASLIVVGARGLGGLRAALLGSVSEGVVRHARRPVLVMHAVDAHAG